MKNQDLQLVTFEQAERLKEVEFNWECDSFYWGGGDDSLCYHDAYGDHNDGRPQVDWEEKDGASTICSAPTVALALKWMRDVKHINYQIDSDVLWNEDNGKHEKLWRSGRGDFTLISTGWKKSYEETESALLDEFLTLIEK